jgi:type II secretory pathway pseudopilin PulG
MLVVITILVLVSAAVAPSLVSMKGTSNRMQTIAGVKRFAPAARERAIQSGKSCQVIYDESTKQIQIQDLADDGTATTAMTVTLGGGIEPQSYQIQGKDVGASDFKLIFSPDGHSNGGGLAFQDFSLSVDGNGVSQYIDGPLPAPNEQIWQAGNLEQRSN